MKKLAFLISLMISANSFAAELTNYDQVKTAISTGKSIHIIIGGTASNAVTYIGEYTPSEFMITDRIAASSTHFTLNNPRYLDKPVYEFVSYTITNDNKLTMTSQVLDVINHVPIPGTKFSATYNLGTSAKIYD